MRLRFLHGGALHGLLASVLGHDLPDGLVPSTPESGRVRFAAGDVYHFGLTLAGEARQYLAGLARVGRAPAGRDGPPVSLGGNFAVELCEPVAELTPDALAGLAARAAEHPALTLRFLSPLRLERPPELVVPGQRFFNAECFPAGTFLVRLGQRLGRVALGASPRPEELPPVPAEADAGRAPDLGRPAAHRPRGGPPRPADPDDHGWGDGERAALRAPPGLDRTPDGCAPSSAQHSTPYGPSSRTVPPSWSKMGLSTSAAGGFHAGLSALKTAPLPSRTHAGDAMSPLGIRIVQP